MPVDSREVDRQDNRAREDSRATAPCRRSPRRRAARKKGRKPRLRRPAAPAAGGRRPRGERREGASSEEPSVARRQPRRGWSCPPRSRRTRCDTEKAAQSAGGVARASAASRRSANGSMTKTTSMNERPDEDHRVHPPELERSGETRPQVEPPSHPEARRPRERDRTSAPARRSGSRSIRTGPSLSAVGRGAGERQSDQGDEEHAADPVATNSTCRARASSMSSIISFSRRLGWPLRPNMDSEAAKVLDRGQVERAIPLSP